MIKTFVYGTPHGFDFYEKDAAYTEYFKGFYISSRKGRRLMVNRKDNGETTYNYLRYGLREVIVRPNSFFGMTIVLDEGHYCPNFNKILEWFDYIFEKVLDEKNIFKRNEDGEIQYAVNKFDDSVSDVEWIKSNLPKILSQAAGTNILQYDNTFVSGRTGQIPCLNDEQTDNYYLSVFRKYYWITLSPEFPKQDEIKPTPKDDAIIGGGSPIELSYPDLKNQLDDFNKRLVPIAAGVNQGSLDELTKMYDNAKYTYDSLNQYLSFIKGNEEAEMFENLFDDYKSLVNSISALLAKMGQDGTSNTPIIPEETNTQYCYNCKQHKDASHFRSPSSMKCIECEAAEQTGSRNTKIQCRKCGKFKLPEEFDNNGNICRSCQEQELNQTKKCKRCGEVKPLIDFPLNSEVCQECSKGINWGKIFRNSIIPILGVIAVFAIVGGIYWLINKEKDGKDDNPSTETVAEVDDGIDGNKVSIDVLNEFLANEQFEDAYKYIADKKDKDDYISHITKAVDTWLWKIIDSSNSSDAEMIKAELNVKITPLLSLIHQLGMDDEYIFTLHQGAKDYARLQKILTKLNISEVEYNEGCQILERIGSKLPSKWDETLSSKWEASKVHVISGDDSKKETKPHDATVNVPVALGPVTLTYTKVDGTEETLTDVVGNVGYDAKPGTKVTVGYPSGKIYFENQKTPAIGSKSITLESNPSRTMTYKFKCDNVVITITINPVTTNPRRH
jgi:hypothetical protein